MSIQALGRTETKSFLCCCFGALLVPAFRHRTREPFGWPARHVLLRSQAALRVDQLLFLAATRSAARNRAQAISATLRIGAWTVRRASSGQCPRAPVGLQCSQPMGAP